MRTTGVTDAAVLVVFGGLVALAFGLVIGPVIASYGGIFFATLTLALSMIAYGVLNKTYSLGGSDGINLRGPSFFGIHGATPEAVTYGLFLFTSGVTVAAASLCRLHFDSLRGLLALAARDNEIRVEYLGASVRRVALVNYVIPAALARVRPPPPPPAPP